MGGCSLCFCEQRRTRHSQVRATSVRSVMEGEWHVACTHTHERERERERKDTFPLGEMKKVCRGVVLSHN